MKRKFLPAYIFPFLLFSCIAAGYGAIWCSFSCESLFFVCCVFIRNMSSFLTQEQKDKVRRRLFVEDNPAETATSDDQSGITPLENCNGGPADSGAESTVCQGKASSSIDQNEPSQNEINIIDLSNMTQHQKYEQMKKWNFDFDNEVPLNGNWEWERVEPPRNIDHKEKICVLGKDEPRDRNV